MADVDLGTDFAGVEDLDANLSVVSGRRCLLEAVMRRWLCPQGALHYAPSYGGGLADFLEGEMVATGALAARLESQATEDERVESCTVTVTYLNSTLTVVGNIDDGDGPFDFTFDVSATGAVILSEIG